MSDGEGCRCAARSESECGCDADWTPQELVDARGEIARLRLTAEEREAIERCIADSNSYTRRATLRGLLERTK